MKESAAPRTWWKKRKKKHKDARRRESLNAIRRKISRKKRPSGRRMGDDEKIRIGGVGDK